MGDKTGTTSIGAYEAKTKFSEFIARAERGESFVVTKNGRPMARITPMVAVDREKARRAPASAFLRGLPGVRASPRKKRSATGKN